MIDTPHWFLTTVVVTLITIPIILGFIKHDYVVFETNKYGYHLVFWLHRKNHQDVEGMVDFILEKIQEGEQKPKASL
jgi:hypothetical protein